MFLSLKTLYRKRTVIWPFTFTQLYGLYPLSIFLFFAYHFVSDMTLINLVFDKIYIVHNKLLDLFLTFKYYQIFISPKSAVEFSIFVLLIVLIYIFSVIKIENFIFIRYRVYSFMCF